MVAQRFVEHLTGEHSSLYALCAYVISKIFLFLYALVVFGLNKFIGSDKQRLAKTKTRKAVPVVKGDPSSPWRQCYVDPQSLDREILECKTLGQIWENSVKKFGFQDCFGTRQLVSVSQEVQHDGRVFEKLELGQYHWRTFHNVNEQVNNVANGLKKVGHRRGERILIYSETRIEFTTSLLACFKCGFPVVTVYATLGIEALLHAIEECSPTTVFTTAKLLKTIMKALGTNESVNTIVYFSHRDPLAEVVVPDALKNSKIRSLSFEALNHLGQNTGEVPRNEANPDDIAMIMYTSGTTSAPKGVIMLQRNLVASITAHSERLPMGVKDTYLGYLPLAHIFEVCAELTLLAQGCRIGFSAPVTLFDGSPGLKKGQRGDCSVLKPTFFVGTPAIFNRIVQAINDSVANSPPWKKELFKTLYDFLDHCFSKGYSDFFLGPVGFRSIRKLLGGRVTNMLTAGAPMSPETHHFLRICFGCDFLQGYGATETSGCGVVSTGDSIFSDEVGPPEVGVDIMLREWAEGGYSPKNAVPQGEILIGGDMVTAGYLGNEKQTMESFIDMYGKRWFATGDIGQIRDDGSLCVIDRKKDLVKLAQGEYISLGKVESCIATSSFVENVCVYGDSFKDYIVALVVPKKDQLYSLANKVGIYEKNIERLCALIELREILLADIRSHCEGKLHKMEIPRKIHLCHEPWTADSGMLTAAMKIKRKCIEKKFRDAIQTMYDERS